MFSSSKKTRQTLQALQEDVVSLRTQLEASAQQAATERAALASLLEQVAVMETRITGMGAELSRQLHELGTDIEKMQQNISDESTNETLTAMKTAQIRLATEQARYEITFRQDLAALANELLKRSR